MSLPHIAAWKVGYTALGLVAAAIYAIDPTYKVFIVAVVVAAIPQSITGAFGIIHDRRIERKIDKVERVTEATHTLSNSAMGAQLLTKVELLQMLAVQAHRLAEVTKEAGDLTIAKAFEVQVEAAKKLYQEHVTKQAIIDAKGGV
jgi:ADP-ribosylglycohydrolase